MKGHKAHHHAKRKAHGGDIESPMYGTDEAAMDLRTKPEPRTNAKRIDDEGGFGKLSKKKKKVKTPTGRGLVTPPLF